MVLEKGRGGGVGGKGKKLGGSIPETSVKGRNQDASGGSHLTVLTTAEEGGQLGGGGEGPSKSLTTPKSAKPEPMLIMVGMMSNFPAYK